MRKYKPEEDNTEIWELYQRGINYKNRIGLYTDVDENYNYYQGDQWGNTDAKGIPTPVFNVIKPVIRYKVSQILQNDVKVLVSCGNSTDPEYKDLSAIATKLTKYMERLWENLKMDYNNECLLYDAAITGNGASYFVYNDKTQEVEMELIDSVNIYPGNPNNADIQSQEYIILAFRRSVESVRMEASAYGFSDPEMIVSDSDNTYTAGDEGKIEIDGSDMCVVLLKMWKDHESETIHFSKSTKSCEYVTDKDTGLKMYPVALMTWEPRKNCFFGISDVAGIIPNQDYINTSAAMMMAHTTFASFPKMVYDSSLIDQPSNEVGVAIGIEGLSMNQGIKDVIGYIAPASATGDIFSMFNNTIQLTKELMGANDGALGNVNPENASGKSILAVMEQTAMPLESIRRRFYNYTEDVALIICDMWCAHSSEGKNITFINNDGEIESGNISSMAFDRLKPEIKIDVGPSTKWNEITTARTLENLLAAKLIPFEKYVEFMPESAGLPRQQILDWLKEEKQKAEQEEVKRKEEELKRQNAVQQKEQMQQATAEGEQMAQADLENFDIDTMIEGMSEEQQREVLDNPELLNQIIADSIGR